jgi:DNA-binding transcriptional regulator LsrR (DeoR family)
MGEKDSFRSGTIWLLRRRAYTQKEVGDSLNVSRLTVNNSLQRGEENLAMCQEIWVKMT